SRSGIRGPWISAGVGRSAAGEPGELGADGVLKRSRSRRSAADDSPVTSAPQFCFSPLDVDRERDETRETPPEIQPGERGRQALGFVHNINQEIDRSDDVHRERDDIY